MSPGSSPGSWSPSPCKTIFWPSLIPVQMSPGNIRTGLLFSLFAHQTDAKKVLHFSHLCQCGPPRSSSVVGSSGLRMLCSGPFGWFFFLVLGSCGTLWTSAVPYLEVTGVHGLASLCHDKTCTPVPLLYDLHDLPNEKCRRNWLDNLHQIDVTHISKQLFKRNIPSHLSQMVFFWTASFLVAPL